MKEDQLFVERDISWLSFNHRVLQEAKDPSVPLYERIKFLAIYSSNLDEFFRVRVASIRSYRKLAKSTKKEMEIKPRKLLKKIRKIVEQQQNEFGRIFREEIIPELKVNGINLIRDYEFNENQVEFSKNIFREKLNGELEWQYLDENKPPFLANKSLYLIVNFKDEKLAMVTIPDVERFVVFPTSGGQYFISFIDDIIRVNLSQVFSGKEISGVYSVKVSRDAEMYIDDEFSGDLLEKIKEGLEERNIGLPVRFLYDSNLPDDVFKQIKTIFGLSKNDLIPGARYHNFNDFFGFPDPSGSVELHNKPLPPKKHPELEQVADYFSALREKDYLLHFPYQKFDYVQFFIEQAASDPAVVYLKITLYRVASNSAIAKSLLKALENGKKVYAFIEAKARFDEESNMYWGRKLSEAGATVRYSFPGIKVHTKLLVVGRHEEGVIRHYNYMATGNFNEKTAHIYSDFGLFTSANPLADEAERVFEVLEGKVILPRTKDIFVAPFTLRAKFEKLINNEIKAVKNGGEAWMILKMNSLEDQSMMNKLIEASQAGVKIKLIVRGICCLIPGIPNFTENIEIVSIVDRFLEHARVYMFCAGGKQKMYLASADWMGRNLSRRVEVAFPIYDEKIKKTIRQTVDLQLTDNVKARHIHLDKMNEYVRNEKEKVRAQIATYELF